MITRNAARGLAVAACAAALGACNKSSTTPQLADARRAYDDAEDSPARTYAPGELQAAHRALERAEDAHDDDPGSHREAQLGYLAGRKAEIARSHGEMAAAERARAQAKANADYHAQLARTAQRQERANPPAAGAKVDRDGDGDHDQRDHDLEVDATPDRARVAHPAAKQAARNDRRAESALQNLSQVASVKEEPRGIVITLSGGLLFPSGETELSPIARQSLDQVAHALAEQPKDKQFLIEGHTDDSGSERQNQQLSARRAQAVADYLMQRDIDADRLRVIGYGESRPIADNDSEEGRSSNRRVEIIVNELDQDDDQPRRPQPARVDADVDVNVDED